MLKQSRHYKLARKRLNAFKRGMLRRGWVAKDDRNWPFHVVVPTEDGRSLSVYCGGFTAVLEVQSLREDGEPDKRYRERAYERIGSLYRYLANNWPLVERTKSVRCSFRGCDKKVEVLLHADEMVLCPEHSKQTSGAVGFLRENRIE